MSPHVCMIVSTNFWHDRRVRKEARAVLDAGYRLTVIAALRPEDRVYSNGGDESDPEFRDAAFAFLPVDLPERPARTEGAALLSAVRSGLWAMRGWARFFKVVRSVRADLYHCHDIDAFGISYFPARMNEGKIIFDCHDIFSEIQIEGSILHRLRPVWRWLERVLPPRADGVIVAASSFARKLEEVSGIDGDEAVRVLNAPYLVPYLDADLIREKFRVPAEQRIALYLGSVNPDRGLGDLLDAVPLFDEGISLAIYGVGHESMWADLRDRISRLDDPSRVLLGSFVPLDEVPEHLASSDAICIPNKYLSAAYDSLPNKFFEGLMAGRPLICNRLPEMAGHVEVIGCGVVCADESPESLAAGINAVMADPVRRQEMGQAGRKAAEERFNWTLEGKKLTDLYARMLENS